MLPLFVLACIVLLSYYFWNQFNKFGYLLSPYNALILIFIFCAAISPVFLYSDESWKALLISDAEPLRRYTEWSMSINIGGFALFFLFLILFSFYRKDKSVHLLQIIENKIRIDDRIIYLVTGGLVILFTFLCLRWNEGTFPLLNGKRDFASGVAGVSQMYTVARCSFSLLGMYFGLNLSKSKKYVLPFLILFLCSLLTGNRSGVLLYLVYPMVVNLINTKASIRGVAILKKAQIASIIFCIFVGIIGTQFVYIRDGMNLPNPGEAFANIIYGNSFSDIRDGALILRGFDLQYGSSFFMGATYLAGLLSAIPSTLLNMEQLLYFKQEYAWGPFSVRLAAWHDPAHFGFRGGWFLESYINFGIIGIVANAIALAYIFSMIEKLYRAYLNGNGSSGMVMCLSVMLTIFSCLICTSSMYELYVQMALLLILISLSYVFKQLEKRVRLAR